MGQTIAVRLLLWAIPWMGVAIFGLWRAKDEYWRAFWLMSGVWALIDALIALPGLLGGESSADSLRRILWINAGLDGLYIAAGLFLWSRRGPTSKGFGAGVFLQGLFLLGFDIFHASHI